MKMRMIIATYLALSGVTCQIAAADEVVITHRSGKVQIITIDTSGDPIDQVSFRRKDAGAPVEVGGSSRARQQQSETEQKKETGAPKFKLKWAPPVDTQ